MAVVGRTEGQADSSVAVLHEYLRAGLVGLARLNGDYATLWDRREQVMLVGVMPLASELQHTPGRARHFAEHACSCAAGPNRRAGLGPTVSGARSERSCGRAGLRRPLSNGSTGWLEEKSSASRRTD